MGERWTGAYHRIDTVLAQLKTRLGGKPINSLELLEHKSARLEEIREQLNAADAIVDALFAVEPDQNTVTLETQATKRIATEVVIDECEDLVKTMKMAIEAKVAAETEATARATAGAEAAPVVVPAAPAAKGNMTPKVE